MATESQIFRPLLGRTLRGMSRVRVESPDCPFTVDNSLIFTLQDSQVLRMTVHQLYWELVPAVGLQRIIGQQYELAEHEIVGLQPLSDGETKLALDFPIVVTMVSEWWDGPADHPFPIGLCLFGEGSGPKTSVYLSETKLHFLGSRSRGERAMADHWREGDTLRVVRGEPLANDAGKILPLRVLHR